MRNRLVLPTLFLLSSVGALAGDLRLERDAACVGDGLRGGFDGGPGFVACDDGRRVVARIRDAEGAVLADLRVDRETAETTFRLAGIDLSRPLDADARAALASLFDGPAPAAVTRLTLALAAARDPQRPVVGAVVVLGQAFERPPRPALPRLDCGTCRDVGTGCLGCCGPGCGGCTVCASACLAHDECVRDLGHLPCVELLPEAIVAAIWCLVTEGEGLGCCPAD